jgi:DNA-binding CsgD family transcriptional regulator
MVGRGASPPKYTPAAAAGPDTGWVRAELGALSSSAGLAGAELIEPLTAREQEVLGLLMEAFTNQEIADRLCVSLRTVETHLGHIYGKLGVRGRPEAMLWAMRTGASVRSC